MNDDKADLINKLIRAEIRYLDNAGWILYIGMGVGDNPDLSYLDEASGQWKTWGEPGSQGKTSGAKGLYTQAQAMTIQRAKDKF
jgi:hypothetical protein